MEDITESDTSIVPPYEAYQPNVVSRGLFIAKQEEMSPWAPPIPTPQDRPHVPVPRVFDRLAQDASDRCESRKRLALVQSLQAAHSKVKSNDIRPSSEISCFKSTPESRRTESVELCAGDDSRGKLDKRRMKELVDRLNGEASKRQLKLEQARRDREEQMLEEAFRLANTRHTNKESLKKLKNHEARTIAKMYKQPDAVPAPRPSTSEQKVFTVSQAKASGSRLMQKPAKATPSSEPPQSQEKLSKEKAEKVVSRLYSKGKTLSASNSQVKFYGGPSDEHRVLRTSSAVRTRPSTQRSGSHLSPVNSQSPELSCPRRQAIQLRARPFVPSPASWDMQSDTTPEPIASVALPCRPDPIWIDGDAKLTFAAVTPQPTTKDSNETPGRPSKDQSEVDSPNVSSISHHCEEDSFTRLTTFPEPKPTPLEKPLYESAQMKERPWSPKLKLPLKSVDAATRSSQKTTGRTADPMLSPSSPQYSEEALYLMRNPIKSLVESLKSPTAQPSAPLSAYRFVVGLNESDEFIYQDDKS